MEKEEVGNVRGRGGDCFCWLPFYAYTQQCFLAPKRQLFLQTRPRKMPVTLAPALQAPASQVRAGWQQMCKTLWHQSLPKCATPGWFGALNPPPKDVLQMPTTEYHMLTAMRSSITSSEWLGPRCQVKVGTGDRNQAGAGSRATQACGASWSCAVVELAQGEMQDHHGSVLPWQVEATGSLNLMSGTVARLSPAAVASQLRITSLAQQAGQASAHGAC